MFSLVCCHPLMLQKVMHILTSAFTSHFASRKVKVNCQWYGWQEYGEDSHVFKPESMKSLWSHIKQDGLHA